MKRSVPLGILLICWLWVSVVSAAVVVANLPPTISGTPAASVISNSAYSF
jgi:hypothetical protein